MLFVCYETMEKVTAQGGLKVIIQFKHVYPKNSKQVAIYIILGRLNYYNLAVQLRMRHKIIFY